MVDSTRGTFLFLAGFSAGFVDSIAGGGGLITLPVVLNLGLPPQVALGTNKFQATFGSGSAALHFFRQGTVPLKEGWKGILATGLGAAGGVAAIQHLAPELLKLVIPYCLLGVALFMLFSPRLGHEVRKPVLSDLAFHMIFGLLLGFYDGFFGPGTGSFWVIAYVLLFGFTLVRATGFTKVMNFVSNLVSLLLFMAAGNVEYSQGLVMAAGQFLGARLGSALVLNKGARFVRPVFITMAIGVTLKLIYENYR
jgi:uncharacterized membrane protein YfcA